MSTSASLTMANERSEPRPRLVAGVKAFAARHGLALLLAVAMGGLLVFPRWWLLSTEPSDGSRIPVTVWGASDLGSDEALQATTIRDAYDGEFPVRAPHLVNHSDVEIQAGAWWQQLIGVSGHVFGGPFESLAVVTTLAATAAFVLLYALSYQLTSSRLAAAAVLPLATLFAHVFFHLDDYALREQWRYLEPLLTFDPEREFVAWTRFLSPVLVLGVFFAFVLSMPRAATSRDFRWSAAAVASLSILIYSYVYYWTAAGVAMALWLLLLFIRGEIAAARRVMIIGALALLFALPEIVIVLNKAGASTPDIEARVGQGDLGVVWTEAGEVLFRLLLGLPFFYALRRRTVDGSFYVALFVAPLLLVAVDGIMPQPWHYRSQVWTAFAIPALVAGSGQFYQMLGEPKQQIALRAVAAAAVFAFVYLAALQLRAMSIVSDTYAIGDDEYAAFQWIEDNVHGDETVASPSIVTTLLVDNLTPAGGYIIGGYNPVAEDSELIDRYLRIQRTYGYGEDSTFARLDPDNGFPFDKEVPESELPRDVEHHVAFYTFYWEVTTPDRLTDRMPAWRDQFRALAREDNVIAAYPVEYLYCGPRERLWPATEPSTGTYVHPAFESGVVTVYRVVEEDDPAAKAFSGC